VDNDGEGGILALIVAAGREAAQSPADRAVGLFGAALIYGDGAITPAIWCCQALEGSRSAGAAGSVRRAAFERWSFWARCSRCSRKEPRASARLRSGDGAVVRGDGVLGLWDWSGIRLYCMR